MNTNKTVLRSAWYLAHGVSVAKVSVCHWVQHRITSKYHTCMKWKITSVLGCVMSFFPSPSQILFSSFSSVFMYLIPHHHYHPSHAPLKYKGDFLLRSRMLTSLLLLLPPSDVHQLCPLGQTCPELRSSSEKSRAPGEPWRLTKEFTGPWGVSREPMPVTSSFTCILC